MIEALVLSNLFLILIIGLPALAILAYVTEETDGGSLLTTIFLLIILFLAWWLASFNIFTFIGGNLTTVIYSMLGYLLAGVLYSFVKFYLYLLKQKNMGRCKSYASNEARSNIPRWIIYWPLSLIWTLLSDVLTRLVNGFVSLFKGIYDNILNYVFKDENEKKANDS